MIETSTFRHEPVMCAEIVEAFSTVPAGVVVDATFGAGGHSTAILDAYPGLSVLGIDRDETACRNAATLVDRFGARLAVRHARFDDLRRILDEEGIARISGALFDLGVSSPQFDRPERGFSYRNDGPLDMRMDATQELDASAVVNDYPEDRLAALLRDNSDERFARRIAAAIVAARPIHGTLRLAEVVAAAIPAPARRSGGHPAKRSFQAIRMEVNGEMSVLPTALADAFDATAPGGRVAVLSYHSGEHRIVADFCARIESRDAGEPTPTQHPSSVRRYGRRVRAPRRASAEELRRNPRSSSARLRVVERV